MVLIPSICEHPGKLYAFSQGRLCSGADLVNSRGLVADRGPGDRHGALFLSKKGNLIAVEVYSSDDLLAPYFVGVYAEKGIDDSPQGAQSVLDRMFTGRLSPNRSGSIGLMQWLGKAETIELETA